MAYTGGPLNEVNGKMGISAPHKSVPIMKLIRYHQPKSKEELVELIKWHYAHVCECGVKSMGTIEMFGENLYQAQYQYWKEFRYTLTDCIQWEYDLFVVQSLKGDLVEKRGIMELTKLLPHFSFEEADGYLDEDLRIDILVKRKEQEVAGIQVKPATFKLMRKEIITFNSQANQKWGKPVLYLFYSEAEEFINLEEVITALRPAAGHISVFQ